MATSTVSNQVRNRIVGALFASQSLFSAAVILAFTLSAIIAADLAGSDNFAGWPNTVTLAARAALAYPIGWLLDRFGRRLGLSLGFLIGTLGMLLSAWSVINGSFVGLLAGAALLGGARASSEQSRYVAAEIFPPGRQAKVIGWIVFAGTIGAIAGPLLVEPATQLAENRDLVAYAGPFLVAALMLIAGGIVVFLLLRPDPKIIGAEIAAEAALAAAEPEADARPLKEIFRAITAQLAVASMTIGQMVMVMLMVITSLHMKHNGHDTGEISLVILAHTLGMFGLSGLTGNLIERHGRQIMIAAGAILLIAACILAPVSTEVPLLAVALFLLGLGWNFAYVAGSSLLSDQLVSAERGRAQGASEMAVAVGAGLGSLGSGYFFEWGGIFLVSMIGLAFSILLLALFIWTRWQTRPVEALAPSSD